MAFLNLSPIRNDLVIKTNSVTVCRADQAWAGKFSGSDGVGAPTEAPGMAVGGVETEVCVRSRAGWGDSAGSSAMTVDPSERAAAASDITNIVAINSQINPAITINVTILASFPSIPHVEDFCQ